LKKVVLLALGFIVLICFTILMIKPTLLQSHPTKPVELPANTVKGSEDSADKEVIYKDKVVALIFHHLDPKEVSGVTISPQHFTNDLDMLQANKYNVISLEQLRQFLKGGPMPNNAILITFDDGYESIYKYALPELIKRNIPAVNFAIVSLVNKKIGTLQYLNWDEMIEMDTAGFTTQSHTYDMHKNGILPNGKMGPLLTGPLKGQSPDAFSTAAYQDIKHSKDKIESNLQQPVYALALPYGIASKQGLQAVSNAGIELIFTGTAGVISRNTNPLALPRIIAGSPEITPKVLDERIRRFTKG
jgi:peptidoglycan/xylan/chitin deacetylase (PgdA/CDA1 family)